MPASSESQREPLSRSVEDYLKAIHRLSADGRPASTTQIADALAVAPPSVTGMVKRLSEQGLLSHEPYRGVTLTDLGLREARRVIRRHRLIESYLVGFLGYTWDSVHDEAERLEHAVSDALVERMAAALGHPQVDPHGDPIPDSKGKMEMLQQINLMQLPVGQQAEICAVGSQQSELLEMLRHKKLQIGSTVIIKQRYSFDKSIEVEINNQPGQSISEQLAKQLFVIVK